MNTSKYKVETGLQVLARLSKKPGIEHFYPVLFQDGPKPGEIIEMFSNCSTSILLMDIITEALFPKECRGVEAGVLVFNCDDNINFDFLLETLRKKIMMNLMKLTLTSEKGITEKFNELLHISLGNLYFADAYDNNQFHATIHNLESILTEHVNISLIVFDTLTSFYWSEQGLKVTRMDLYLKSLLRTIQNITKDHKISVLYTRPEYFCSHKDSIDNLEACCKEPTTERLNYRLQVVNNDDGTFQVNIRKYQLAYERQFKCYDHLITWL